MRKEKIVRLLAVAGLIATLSVFPGAKVGGPAEQPYLVVEYIRPGGSCASPSGTNDTVLNETWKLPAGGLAYQVNPAVPRGLDSAAALAAIQAAAASWDNSTTATLFSYGGTTSMKAGKLDGVNAVSFGGAPGGSIAVAYMWFTDSTRTVLREADMSLANGFRWSANGTLTEDPNLATDDCLGETDRMDVRDIATHEFGHWVGVKHTPTDNAYNHRTMYPFASYKELFKRSLAAGDVAGVPAKYGP